MAIKIKTDTAPDERKKSTVARKPVSDIESVPETPVDTTSRTFRTRAPNNTFDRKAYMAEYMRQYNAKKKAKKQNDVD